CARWSSTFSRRNPSPTEARPRRPLPAPDMPAARRSLPRRALAAAGFVILAGAAPFATGPAADSAPGSPPAPAGNAAGTAATSHGAGARAQPPSTTAPPAASVPVRRVPAPEGGKISPAVAALMGSAPAGGYVEALVEMAEQADLDALMARFEGASLG